MVLAGYKNPDAKRAGHIAIVRPAEVGPDEVKERGPHITQVATTSYKDTDVQTGFKHRPGAWERGEVLSFTHLSPER